MSDISNLEQPFPRPLSGEPVEQLPSAVMPASLPAVLHLCCDVKAVYKRLTSAN